MGKIGVIDVGGGLRGIYAAGVFDWCMDNGVQFDYGIGISAGSANLASYLSSQRGRNYLFYEEYSMRKEYMGAGNMLHGGSFLNLQYIYGTLSNRECENPLDFERMTANPMEWYMIATDATTGKPKYFTRGDMRQDDYRVLMASCCIPVACKPIEIGGVPYYDGALGDTIPLQKAFADGCDKVVLILTKPVGTIARMARTVSWRGSSTENTPTPPNSWPCGRSIITKVLRWPKSWPPRARCLLLRQTTPAASRR